MRASISFAHECTLVHHGYLYYKMHVTLSQCNLDIVCKSKSLAHLIGTVLFFIKNSNCLHDCMSCITCTAYKALTLNMGQFPRK